MTDKFPPLSTQIAPPSQSPTVPLPNGTPIVPTVPKAETVEEEEPYTIKCICDFTGDDGNTIYCETCDTWQHIECYYPDSIEDALREDFSHSCVDCEPRDLDKQKAIQRQRRRLEAANSSNSNLNVVEEQTTDKKPKRPPTKNHKKRPKQTPTDIQTNGSHPSSTNDHVKHTLPHDHANAPPPKKSKTSHKASHSISSQAPKRSPPHSTIRLGHPPSPATTPPDVPIDFDLYTPTSSFVAAYMDHHVNSVTSNSFAALSVSATLAAWPRDPARMKRDAGCEPKDVFRPPPPKSPRHQLNVEQKMVNVSPDAIVPLRYLTTPAAIPKDDHLIELNGSIDFQKDYCARPENRWDQLTFPLPFVFFHDTLPLCIDTRKEGSIARFVRRSCRPTARLETYLDPSNTALYHFMLVADREIKPGEQITLPWDFRLPKETRHRWRKLLGLDVDEEDVGRPAESQSEDAVQLHDFISVLLGEYGGCACELGKGCAFARFHTSWAGKAHGPSRPAPPKKRSRVKQPKAQIIVSPTGTGHATNSRAASEGHLEEVPENDRRSVSRSARSKPPSRDRTPAPGRQPSLDVYGMTAEPTEREKRKAAALEENIRRTEEQKPKKKKARVSDGTSASSTKSKSTKRGSASNSSSATSATAGHSYVDVTTSRSTSNSPAGVSKAVDSKNKVKRARTASDAKDIQMPRPITTASRPVYVDHGTQTKFGVDWYLQKLDDQPRRRVVSLAKRLLQNRHKQRMDNVDDHASPNKSNPTSPVTTELSKADTAKSPTAENPPTAVPPSSTTQTEPAPTTTSPVAATGNPNMGDAPPVPSSIAKTTVPTGADQSRPPGPSTKVRAAELRVQMPPVPVFNGPSSTTSTPLSATGSVHSPFSATTNSPSPFGPAVVNGMVHPSPQRKKLSLSDYRKSRNMTAAATKPSSSLSTATRAPSSLDDTKVIVAQENAPTIAGRTSDTKLLSSVGSMPTTNGSL